MIARPGHEEIVKAGFDFKYTRRRLAGLGVTSEMGESGRELAVNRREGRALRAQRSLRPLSVPTSPAPANYVCREDGNELPADLAKV